MILLILAMLLPTTVEQNHWYHLDPLEWALIGTTAADVIAIEMVLHNGGWEENPFMQSRATRIGFNTAMTGVLIYLSRRLTETGRVKASKLILLIPTIGHGVAAGWSLQVNYRVKW